MYTYTYVYTHIALHKKSPKSKKPLWCQSHLCTEKHMIKLYWHGKCLHERTDTRLF